MPPVFGPVSPSPIRLKSCAGASGTTTRPSASAKTDTSSPTSSSSITIGPGKPAAARRPSSSCSTVSQTKTPFPAASPSTLTTHGGRATASVSAVGTPAAARTALAKLFEPSIRAAARPGPKTATPLRRSRSATPATSGASGPITTRSMSRLRARPSRLSPSSARTGWQSPSRAIPGLPGAACSDSSPGACASFHASACSRPPDPTRSTFTAAESTSRNRSALGGRGGDAGERVDHVRVELRPRAAAELLERFLGGAPCAVGPVGRDRAVGVAAADDARDKRDLVADEPVGVAAAAEALVAGADEAGRRFRARRRPGRASPRRRPCASRRSPAPRAVSGPGLLMISFGIRILPTSCNSATNSVSRRPRESSPSSSATAIESETTSRLCEPV